MTELDYTKPVRTKRGEPVRILCTDLKGPMPVVGIVQADGLEYVTTWTATGGYSPNGELRGLDLEQAP